MSHSSSAPIPRPPAPASPPAQAGGSNKTSKAAQGQSGGGASTGKPAPAGGAATTTKKEGQPARIPMVIQKIPPFNPNKVKSANPTATGAAQDKDKEDDGKDKNANANASNDANSGAGGDMAGPKLNVNASPFKLKPNAPTFKPVVSLSCHVICLSLYAYRRRHRRPSQSLRRR